MAASGAASRKRSAQTRRRAAAGNLPYDDPATRYASDVVSGATAAGPHVRAACRRHLRDLEEGPSRGLHWDLAAQHRVLRFFRTRLRLNGGQFEGQPFDPQPWQCFVLGSLFGWKWAATGYRRFDRGYIETGKGSGKSPLVAGIGLYMLTADLDPETGEPEARAEIYAAAADKDQAAIMFRDAVAMVNLSPSLAERITVSGSEGKEYNLAYHASASFFRPITSKPRGRSGPRPHCAILDEVHEHRDSTVIDLMIAGFKFRRQPLALLITNSGIDRNSVCFREHTQSIKVAAGDIQQDSRFAYVCALDEADDPFIDESCWPKGNPGLHVTIQPDYLRRQIADARGFPDKEAEVKRLNFCVWGEKVNPLISRERWEACEAELDLEDYAGKRCIGAIDLSAKLDLTALSLAFPDAQPLPVFTEFWTPADTMRERAERDQVPYTIWHEQGHLHAPPGSAIDYDFVAQRLGEIGGIVELAELNFDRHRIDDLKRALDRQGVDYHIFDPDDAGNDKGGPGFALRPFGQGFVDMGPAVDAVEEGFGNGTLLVASNPVMRMCASNVCVIKNPAGDRKFDKNKSTGRIDGMVTLAMVLRRAKVFTEAGKAHYLNNDLLVI